jgi:hypothetical protein
MTRFWALLLAGILLALTATTLRPSEREPRGNVQGRGASLGSPRERSMGKKIRIDLVDPKRRRTAPPPGWLAYDGTPYRSGQEGYGWIDRLPPDSGADRGEEATILLPNGTKTSSRLLGRPELAHWQGTHRENRPLVFRVDLANGWYRVACASVDPGTSLPLVDQRSFKCRAHGVVFAGPKHGRPLAVTGMTLVEGADVVEVTEGHLRVVIGDPAYAGWTWQHPGPWYEGWPGWFGRWGGHRYAERWYQKLTRTVDPGFHHLRLNSLEIEPASAPAQRGSLVFRDFFNRDDAPDINSGVPNTARWRRIDLDSGGPSVRAALETTALALTGTAARSSVAFVQHAPSPAGGLVRYSTRVSVFTGGESRSGNGVQEAGLLLLGDSATPDDSRATFVGVTVADGRRGGLTVRVGNGAGGYRADVTINGPRLPFETAAGEYDLAVEHDVERRILSRITVNGFDVTSLVPPEARRPHVDRGLFGVRAAMDPGSTSVVLRQFFWLYRVDCLRKIGERASC